MKRQMVALGMVLAGGIAWAGEPAELEKPVQIMAGGQAIDVQGQGHSAPFFGDFDGDGINDLLVGQFDEGRLRIYRNAGTNTSPRFEDYVWFMDGADTGRVPTG